MTKRRLITKYQQSLFLILLYDTFLHTGDHEQEDRKLGGLFDLIAQTTCETFFFSFRIMTMKCFLSIHTITISNSRDLLSHRKTNLLFDESHLSIKNIQRKSFTIQLSHIKAICLRIIFQQTTDFTRLYHFTFKPSFYNPRWLCSKIPWIINLQKPSDVQRTSYIQAERRTTYFFRERSVQFVINKIPLTIFRSCKKHLKVIRSTYNPVKFYGLKLYTLKSYRTTNFVHILYVNNLFKMAKANKRFQSDESIQFVDDLHFRFYDIFREIAISMKITAAAGLFSKTARNRRQQKG